jgi:hypothetical protein
MVVSQHLNVMSSPNVQNLEEDMFRLIPIRRTPEWRAEGCQQAGHLGKMVSLLRLIIDIQ